MDGILVMNKEKAIRALNELLDELNKEIKPSNYLDHEYGIHMVKEEKKMALLQ